MYRIAMGLTVASKYPESQEYHKCMHASMCVCILILEKYIYPSTAYELVTSTTISYDKWKIELGIPTYTSIDILYAR